MLIFVQEYKTVDKKFIRFWKNKREQINQQKGSLKHLKKYALEVMTSSSKTSSSEAHHQKQFSSEHLKIIRG